MSHERDTLTARAKRMACDCSSPDFHQTGRAECMISQLLELAAALAVSPPQCSQNKEGFSIGSPIRASEQPALSEGRDLRADIEKAANWQPIDTAPKDGTEFIVYREDAGVFTVAWEIPNGDADPDGVRCLFDRYGDDITGDPPTHWLPLPDPPQAVPAVATPLDASDVRPIAHDLSSAVSPQPQQEHDDE